MFVTWFEKGVSHSTTVTLVFKVDDKVRKIIENDEESELLFTVLRHAYAVSKLKFDLLLEVAINYYIPEIDLLMNLKNVKDFPTLISSISETVATYENESVYKIRKEIYNIIDELYNNYFNLMDLNGYAMCSNNKVYLCLHQGEHLEKIDLEECLIFEECKDCKYATFQCDRPYDSVEFWKYVSKVFEEHVKQVKIDLRIEKVDEYSY